MTNNPTPQSGEEGGAPGLLPCPNPACRSTKVQSASLLYPFYIYCSDCLMKGPREGSDNLGQRWNSLPRTTQPATAPRATLPCTEYEWGCPNYSDDRSRWCDNCRTRATPADIAERARRAAERVAVWAGGEGRPDGKAIDEIADIIAAEFGEAK